MSLVDVAKITKIQPRILERLETGSFDGLPADVFVRGFVRSFARCVGLEEAEALRRYAACGFGAPAGATMPAAASAPEVRGVMGPSGTPEPPTGQVAAGTADLTPTARALVEAMAELVPATANPLGHSPKNGSPVPGREATASGRAARAPDRRWHTANPLGHGPNGSPVPGREATASGEAAGSWHTETCATPPSAVWVTPRAMVAVDAVELAAGSLQDLPLASAPAADDAPAATVVDAAPPVGEATASAAALAQPVLESEATSIAEAALASPPVAVAPVAVAPVAMPVSRGNDSRKKRRRARRDKRLSGSAPSRPSRELMATGTPAGASPIAANDEPTATWAPKMPPAAPSVPWRKPAYAAAAGAMVPSLVIDDADPDSAERVLEERAEKHAIRRSFLPPILLDREDRSARQGGLTLAVIILLIAATLTLSYLMRRPSASGDGMTQRSAPATKLG